MAILRSHLMLGLASTTLLLVAGCGGGSVGSTPAPTPAPTPTPTPTPTPSPTPSPTPTSFATAEYNRSTGPAVHNAIPAWSAGYTGSGVTIGIIDSGIDTDNPEFAGRISSASRDVASNRGLDNPDSSHGTMVALIAAAARDNTGIMGIAYQSTLGVFRADDPGTCANTDPDKGCEFFDSDIAAGVNAAVAAGAKVINVSLGGGAPNSTLRAAIGNAANAGVVVVVAAGNDGDSTDPKIDPNNPDTFASGLRAAGRGNVIIAGSVSSLGVISDFSNKAGAEAQWYLTAQGERVCCVYENGTMKVVTNPDGTRSVYVVSGTSFATPQIAGAAALLRQAFPNLTAAQVVDILLRSARDAGAAGTDAIYGRGILDIGAAISPQGQTALAGSTTALPLGDSTVVTSAPMGDAGRSGAGLTAVVLDSYGRAYDYNLGAGMRAAPQSARLTGALASESRSFSSANDVVVMSFSVDARGRLARQAFAGPLRMTRADADAARVLAARAALKIAPRAQLAFAYAQGADGLVAQVQGRERAAFLIARDPVDDQGFGQTDELSIALRRQFGPWGLTASAQRGTALTAPVQDAAAQFARVRREGASRWGLALDRRFGAFDTALGASWLSEDRTLLGARLHEGLGGRGAETLFFDAALGWKPSDAWRLGASWRSGFTHARSGGTLLAGSNLRSSAWAIDATRSSVFGKGDSLGLRISQPLRVDQGGLWLSLPVAYSYATLEPTFARRSLPLSPSGREIDAELVWRGELWGGSAMASLFHRKDPGHIAAQGSDTGVGISYVRKF